MNFLKENVDTKYNLVTRINPNKQVDSSLYRECVSIFEDAGLIGEFNINQIGKVKRGIDTDCDLVFTGSFDIFEDLDNDMSASQLLNHAELTTSGFDEIKQEALSLGRIVVDLLERVDYKSAILSWNQYRDMSFYEGMEIETPVGRQSIHVHLDHNNYPVQFLKTKNNDLWDFYLLKDHINFYGFDNLKLKTTFIDRLKKKLDFKEKRIKSYQKRIINGTLGQVYKLRL